MNNWLAERWFRVIANIRDKIGGAEKSKENLSRNSLAKVRFSRLIFAIACKQAIRFARHLIMTLS